MAAAPEMSRNPNNSSSCSYMVFKLGHAKAIASSIRLQLTFFSTKYGTRWQGFDN